MKLIFIKKYIFIIISLILIFLYKKIRVAICTMVKKENLYIKEFIKYYDKLGIDTIFIYDDNDNNTERIKDVIPNNIKVKVIIFENIKKTIKKQSNAYTHCYNHNNNNKKYDWFLMIDIDEYLIIKKNTLKKYLNSLYLKKCDFIKINWVIPTDNNLIYYDNRTLFERFSGKKLKSIYTKSIIRGNIEGLIYWVHVPYNSSKKIIACDNRGEIINSEYIKSSKNSNINYDKAYFMHFSYKSAQEYLQLI